MDAKLLTEIIIITIGGISLLYTIGVFLVGFKHDETRRNFAIFCLAISFWILSQALLLNISDYSSAVLYIDVVYTLANVVALSFSAFIASLTRTRKKYHEVVMYSSIGFVIGQLLLFFTKPVSGIELDPSTGIYSVIYNYAILPLIVLYPVTAFVLSIVTILRSKTVTKKSKKKLIATALSYVLIILIVAFAFPGASGAWPVLRFAAINLVTLGFMLAISKQVFLERLIDLRKSGWRLLLRWVGVWSSLLISLFLLTATFIRSNNLDFSDTFFDQFLQAALTAGVTLAVVLTTDRLIRKWLKRYEPDIKSFNAAMSELHFDLGYRNLSKQFLEDIALFFKPDKIAIIVEMKEGHKIYAFNGGYSKRRINFVELNEKDPFVKDALKHLPHAIHGKIGMNVKHNKSFPGYKHLFDIHAQHVRGVVVVSDKYDEVAYTESELVILSSAVQQYSLLLENSAQFEQIQNFNVTLKKEVKNATKELSRTYEKLQELDATKDEFISMASHQLRTPLTSMKGYVSMVLEGDAGEITDTQRQLLNQAFISSQRMVYLIADLLNVSRLKSGKFVIEPKPTYLPDTIESEISQVYEVAKARGLALEFKRPKNFPTLMLDETKTRQVIMNFTDNAIYYTPKGGKVVLSLQETDDFIEFRVKDSGIGVSPKDQKQLFSKFFRASNARRARPDGTGLGLYMAKKVITAQGGQIIFESAEGKGSIFGFKFPKSMIAPYVKKLS